MMMTSLFSLTVDIHADAASAYEIQTTSTRVVPAGVSGAGAIPTDNLRHSNRSASNDRSELHADPTRLFRTNLPGPELPRA